MSYSNGKITAPISASDPYMVMGVGQYNGVYDVSYICRNSHGKINRDSLFKPYEYPSVENKNFATGGDDGYYGYTIPMTTNYSVLDLKSELWKFNPVSENGWCRLLDFEGYNHTVKYIQSNWGCGLIGDPLKGDSFRISFNNGNLSGLVSPYNMEVFKNCYMAVAIYGGISDNVVDLTFRYAQCGENKIGESAGELITIATSDFTLKDDYNYVIPFISEYKFAKGTDVSTTGNYKKWSLNYNKSQTIRLSEYELILYSIASRTLSKLGANSISVNITLRNNNDGDISIYTLYIQIELYDEADCKGNKIFTNQGLDDNTVYKYKTPITLGTGLTKLDTANVGWNPSYTNAKSLRAYLADPYHHYEFLIGTINL